MIVAVIRARVVPELLTPVTGSDDVHHVEIVLLDQAIETPLC
jgi:hypothetical protein